MTTADAAALLQAGGMRVTAQRVAVLRAVSEDPHRTADEIADLDQRATSVVAALGAGTRAVPLDVAFHPNPGSNVTQREPVVIGLIRGFDSIEGFGRAFARAFGHPPSATALREGDHWLPAPNGIHFHPPMSLWIDSTEAATQRSTDDVTALLVHHEIEDVREVLLSGHTAWIGVGKVIDPELHGPYSIARTM